MCTRRILVLTSTLFPWVNLSKANECGGFFLLKTPTHNTVTKEDTNECRRAEGARG